MRGRRDTRSRLGRTPAGALLAVVLLAGLMPGLVGAQAFPSTDVVLVLDVSGSMELLSEIPQDFPHRDEYQASVNQLIALLENRQRKKSLRELTGGAQSGLKLAQLQQDLETYFQNHQIDPKTQSRLGAARRAVGSYLDLLEVGRRAHGTNDRVSLVTFESALGVNQPLTADFAAVRATLDTLEPQGGTNMGAGLQAALDRLGPAAPGTRQQIILLTDGFNNEGLTNEQILAGPAQRAKERGIPVYTVGFGLLPLTVDGAFLAELARATDGAYIFADSPAALNATLVAYQAYQTGQVVGNFQGTLTPGQKVVAGTLAVPAGKQSLRLALEVGNRQPDSVEVRLVAPNGRSLAPGDQRVEVATQGGVRLLTVATPEAGQWRVELTRPLVQGAARDPLPYSVTASVDGVSADRPIAAAASPTSAPDRWRPLLIAGSVAVGALAFLFLLLTLRGLVSRRASTGGGCFFGCVTVLLVAVIGVGWGAYLFWNAPLFSF